MRRREFLQAGVGVWLAGRAARGQEKSPNAKLRIACIGVGGRGSAAIQVARREELAAICDVDDRTLEKVGAQVPEAKRFGDYREMLEAAKDLDAVIVSAPDHHHALASLLALRRGKHVYCEKPLAHSVAEARLMADTAARARVATQEGTQGHSSDPRRRVVEILRSGAIGEVTEIHAWSNRPIWPSGMDRPAAGAAAPDPLHWDLWLGPAPERPYHAAYLPFKWRGWWDFGNGAIGDMASHHLDAAFWALKLGRPISVEAEGEPLHAESTPRWMIVRYEFPARGESPPVKLVWYDGGKKPPDEHLDGVLPSQTSGTVFVGTGGRLVLVSEQGAQYKLLPEKKFADYKPPDPTLPRVPANDHYAEWISACKGEGKALCGFAEAGPMAEAILLATVAFRVGKKIEWDGTTLRARNCPEATALLQPAARKGWALPSRPGIGIYK